MIAPTSPPVPFSALAEPFFVCLLASMIWAPIVLAMTARRRPDAAAADKVWPLALSIAALPALAAPLAAALGVSLRAAPAPMPIPPLPIPAMPVAASGPAAFVPLAAPLAAAPAHPSGVTLAALFEASAALYLYGFLMFMAIGVARRIWFSYRVGYATPMDHPRLEAAFEDWRRRIGVRRKPRYAFTDAVTSVCVHGIARPVVLMPDALLEHVGERDVELMVAHEMAHVKRGDTALFAFCGVIRAIFWFNPFMQRIAARAALAAEQAADALVIAAGAERRRYARCFVEGLRFAAADGRFGERALVPSFTPFDRRSRRARLDAILSGRGAPGMTWRGRVGVVVSVAAAAGLAFAQAALAVAPRTDEVLSHAPVNGKVVAGFAKREISLDGDPQDHTGVDIVAPRGTKVRAAGDGVVSAATDRYRGLTAWGNVVVIDHGGGLMTRYAHLDRYSVAAGDPVKAGETIGAVGDTGETRGRAHLHFEVIDNGVPVDPAPIVLPDPMSMPAPAPLEASPLSPTPPAPVEAAPGAPLPGKIANGVAMLKTAPAFSPMAAPRPAEAPDPVDVPDSVTEAIANGAMNGEFAGAIIIAEAHDYAFDVDVDHDNLPDAEEARMEAALARREAAQARAEAARIKAQHERERARAERERARQEHMAAKLEHALDKAMRERDEAVARIERAFTDRGGVPLVSEKEILAIQEQALRDAQDDLARRLVELERRRAELERAEKDAE